MFNSKFLPRFLLVRPGPVQRRYGADVRELAGIGHDMMLDGGWEQPWSVISDWLKALRVEAISHEGRQSG
jgi:hypothetical protein